MLEESVFVEYTMQRDVYVDGTRLGTTNELMTVETGNHTFDLGKPNTYSPKSVTKLVYGTSPLAPLVITFTPEL
ncbi:MAG TPA: hypothetical protein VH087_10300 [Thermoanaerobaculia bacterium]|jgi:hypothetical protein|nr:hypothetical protein [Thermoanaerobaculia bacterium]